MARPRHISEADKALLERAVAVGSTAYRDNEGGIVLLVPKNTASLSIGDRKRLRAMIDESNAELVAQGGRIVATPNPANLIGGGRYYFLKPTTDAQIEDAIKISRFSHAAERVEKLRRHAELHETAEKLAGEMPKEVGRLDDDWHAIIPTDPFWAELAYAEMLAIAYDAAPRVIRDDKRQAAAKRGGKRGGQAKAKDAAATWREEAISVARKLLASGKTRRNLASILASRFGKSDRIVRDLLKKTEIG